MLDGEVERYQWVAREAVSPVSLNREEDIQDALLGIWSAAQRVDDGRGDKIAYYRSCARGRMLNEWRSRPMPGRLERKHQYALDKHNVPIDQRPKVCPIEDRTAVTVDQRSNELSEFVWHHLDRLTERERRMVEMRFFHDMLLSEIGAVFEITPERVRQILADTILVLRAHVLKEMR